MRCYVLSIIHAMEGVLIISSGCPKELIGARQIEREVLTRAKWTVFTSRPRLFLISAEVRQASPEELREKTVNVCRFNNRCDWLQSAVRSEPKAAGNSET